MQILYATRLFSGLETSIAQCKWQPTGVPTIHKMIERLDRDHTLKIVLAAKGGEWRSRRDTHLSIGGLRSPVHVLSSYSLGGLTRNGAVRDVRHAIKLRTIAAACRPDLVYVDHANVLGGALIARTLPIPVLFRVMGVYPFMRQALERPDPAARLMTWAYRSPFAHVLCTEDGSGAKSWLDKALAPTVDRDVLINGVDQLTQSHGHARLPFDWPRGRVVVLFVGKLEREKGAGEFLAGFLAAARQCPGRLAALMIGTGSLKPALQDQLTGSGLSDSVLMLERVPHAAMLDVQARADIYVSLNRLGSLSNANLEAMRVGSAMVMPRQLPDVGEINPAAALLPTDAFHAIERPDDVAGLTAAILSLAEDAGRRRNLSDAMRAAAARLIPTWEHRIDQEMTILDRIAGRERSSG